MDLRPYLSLKAPQQHGQGEKQHEPADGQINKGAGALENFHDPGKGGQIQICREGHKGVEKGKVQNKGTAAETKNVALEIPWGR